MRNNEGENNPNWRGGLPTCLDCGITISIYAKRCKECNKIFQIGVNSGNYKTGIPKCMNCGKALGDRRSRRCSSCNILNHHKIGLLKKHLSNEYNPFFIDGKYKFPYPKIFNSKFKYIIRERDNHECQLCNKKERESKRALDVHHIDYNKENLEHNNLITLCLKCHMKTNFNRDYWFAYFNYIMEETL